METLTRAENITIHQLVMLAALRRHGAPMRGTQLRELLEGGGFEMSEEAVYMVLSRLRKKGLVRKSEDGFEIRDRGAEILDALQEELAE